MYGLLIFDLDGTLVDSRHDIALSVNLTLDEFNLPHRPPEVIYGFIGGGMHNLIRKSLPEGMDSLVENGVDVFWEIYREHVLDTTRLYPGIKEMLERLSDGHRLAVVTNKPCSHTLILKGRNPGFVTVRLEDGLARESRTRPCSRWRWRCWGARNEESMMMATARTTLRQRLRYKVLCCRLRLRDEGEEPGGRRGPFRREWRIL
jgi:hypothetical protein